MSLSRSAAADCLQRLAAFDTIIDARSPAEYADDHLPGAVNWPVLDDDERRDVGTEYKQVSAFDARKHGATMVARRIADIVERHVQDKPREWQPLVYCWRGGQRSGTLAWFLGQIGFRMQRAARRLQGLSRAGARAACARCPSASSSPSSPGAPAAARRACCRR